MDTRKLRIVKPPLLAIGICEACNSQFTSSKRSQEEAEKEIKAAFDAHEYKVGGQSERPDEHARLYGRNVAAYGVALFSIRS